VPWSWIVSPKLGCIDVVVANAGIAINTPIGKGRFDDVRRTIETNVLGAIATIEAAVELFRKQGGGHVVGISSVAAARGMKGQGAYSASKAALSRYLESLRAEVLRDNIRVRPRAGLYRHRSQPQHSQPTVPRHRRARHRDHCRQHREGGRLSLCAGVAVDGRAGPRNR
jgi:nucleoside-diphosphate-sugar epimerase